MKAAACSCRVRHKLDPRLAQGFHDVQVLLAREAEDALDTLVLERGNKKIGAFGHRGTSPYAVFAAMMSIDYTYFVSRNSERLASRGRAHVTTTQLRY
jgi:hypothetical protein